MSLPENMDDLAIQNQRKKEDKPRRKKNSPEVVIDKYGEELDDRQLKFVREWIADGGNAINAYMRAFPDASVEVARVSVYRLMRNPKVVEFRKQLFRHRADKMGLRASRVLSELCRIAFADIGDIYDHGPDGNMRLRKWEDVNPDARKAISKIKITQRKEPETGATIETVDIQFHSKSEALKSLCQYLGIGTDGNDAIRELAAAIAGRAALEAGQKPSPEESPDGDYGRGKAD